VGTGVNYTYVPANGDMVEVTLTSDAPCASPATASHSVAMGVLALQYPGVSFNANPGDTVCAGMAVTLTAVPVYGGASPSFTWLEYGTPIGTGPVFTYIPANGDLVSVFMASNYPCLVSDTVTGPQAPMAVDTPIIPSVAIRANPGTTIAPGRGVTFTAEVTNGGTGPTYQWYVNGDPVAGATSASYTKSNFDSTFEDSVSVVVASGGVCPMSSHNWVYIQVSNVGVKTVGAADGVSVLPNPNKGTFTITGAVGAMDGEVTIEITDLLGQAVYQTQVPAPGGKISKQVTLGSQVANGMYLLTLHTQQGNPVFHVVVEQ